MAIASSALLNSPTAKLDNILSSTDLGPDLGPDRVSPLVSCELVALRQIMAA